MIWSSECRSYCPWLGWFFFFFFLAAAYGRTHGSGVAFIRSWIVAQPDLRYRVARRWGVLTWLINYSRSSKTSEAARQRINDGAQLMLLIYTSSVK
ncbi:hypothetical protein F4809DRAFT_436664 [Biscogniauxia mediterranea]|nr:hypothetical protein F4809DRAFT_436664 [Biscogniauxia mediterranea]